MHSCAMVSGSERKGWDTPHAFAVADGVPTTDEQRTGDHGGRYGEAVGAVACWRTNGCTRDAVNKALVRIRRGREVIGK